MFRPRPLFLFSVLIFYSAFGDSKNIGKSEITEVFKKGDSRKDAEQDPFTSVFLASQAGNSPNTHGRTPFQARFASIEIVPGSEYIRYVPDSSQSPIPIWTILTGNYASILDCARAAHAGDWPMFKYDGSTCKVMNTIFSLSVVPACEEEPSDAVFILSTAAIGPCPMPRFLVGDEYTGAPVCGLVSTTLMTFDEARSFCDGVYPNNELTLYIDGHHPVTTQDAINKCIELGYTTTNLWVDAEEIGANWYGLFEDVDWFDGQFPVYAGPYNPYRVAYMDKDAGFLLQLSDRDFRAGALCITTVVNSD